MTIQARARCRRPLNAVLKSVGKPTGFPVVVALLLLAAASAAVAAAPSLEWAPGNGGDKSSLFSEANWIDPATGLVPPAGTIEANLNVNRSLYIRTGMPGGGSGATANLLMGSGELWVSHAVLRMSATSRRGIFLDPGNPMAMTDAKVLTEFVSGGNVVMKGRSELTLYGGDPLTNCVIDLQSSDCFVVFQNRRPSGIDGTYLSRFTVNGAAAVEDSNVYIREYYNGAVIRSKPPSNIAMKAFDLPNLQGAQSSYAPGFSGAIAVGSTTKNSTTKYTVRGWGTIGANASDQFHFAYRSLTGDGEIIARVDSVEDVDSSAATNIEKGGVMIRESLDTNARFVMVSHRADNQVARIHRTTAGQNAVVGGNVGGTATNKFVRLVRTGNSFSSYYSIDSAAGPWTQISTATTIAMPETVYFGLVATSGDGGNICGSVLSSVAITQGGISVGTSAFGLFDDTQDVYSYWAKEDQLSSFLLKKGYQVTLAEDAAGLGYSKVYVATEADLLVNLPPELDNKVSWMRVLPWRWIAKKGWGGSNATHVKNIGAYWKYEWEPTGSSTIDQEFVPMIKGAAQNKDYRWEEVRARAHQTHFLCFNEPMSADQGNLTVDEAIALWPKALKLGLRLGSPSRTDGDKGDTWLQNFMTKADAAGLRVDFVNVHNYNKTTASALKTWLEAEYAKYQRPIWLTEFNRDNDETTTAAQHKDYLAAVLPMLESLSFIERYAYYNFGGNNMSLFNGDNTVNATGETYRDIVSTPAYVNTGAGEWCTVALTAPSAAFGTVTNPPVQLAATVSLDAAVVANVEFFANDVSLGQVAQPPYQLSVGNLPVGLNTLYATVTTTSGERATSAAKQINYSVAVTNEPGSTVVDNGDPSPAFTLAGSWVSSTTTPGYWGANYLTDGDAEKGAKSATFTPTLPSNGYYQVLLRWTANANRADHVPVSIVHSGGTSTVAVNQQANGGAWVPLLTAYCAAGTNASVTIGTAGTTGYVIADAVRFMLTESVPAVPVFLESGMAAPGVWSLRFSGTTNHAYQVWRAQDVQGPWTNIASVVIDPLGLGEYLDTAAPASRAFYRTAAP